MLERDTQRLNGLQERLYAEARWAVLLLVFQAMDAAGKDGAIKHVMSGINPQDSRSPVQGTLPPGTEHDYLWRTALRLPERGRIGIFNRSHYEEVLVARVHPESSPASSCPPHGDRRAIWEERFEDIRAFEQHLVRNGTVVLKFFLNVSTSSGAGFWIGSTIRGSSGSSTATSPSADCGTTICPPIRI